MTRPALIAAAAVALLAGGYALGRYAAPVRIQERIVESDREALRVEFSRRVESSTTRTVALRTSVVTRWEPSGAVTRTEQAAEDRHEEAHATEATQGTRVEYREKLVERERLVERDAPAWRVSASAGHQLSGNPGGFTYGAEVSRRVIGPLWFGVGARTDRSLMATVGWEW